MISTLQKGAFLEIGSDSGFSGVSIGCFKKIIIGKNVKVGANVLITDGDWHLDDARVSDPKPILIGDNVWLGYGVVVMKGVTIGDNSVIGINSVVIKDIPSNVVAAGNPCKVIKAINS
jgi:acetyltransferase-like isoleucine patch superfamily enzyme